MLKYYFLLISIFILGGCSLTDNDQPIPSYLIVNEVFVATSVDQGAPTHNIEDIWVFTDNELIGVFALPAKVPIIVNGETTDFTVYPGIRNNGETSRSFIYQLMNLENFTIPLAPGEEVEKTFTFTYKDNAIFDFVEGFESTGHIFTVDLDFNSETKIISTDESAIAGNMSGKISLDQTNEFVQVASFFKFERSQNAGIDSYLEMDYKSDVPFVAGIIYVQEGQEVTQPLLIINPQSEWSKIYVDYTQILTSPALENYRVYFSTNLESLNKESGEIFLDNLKFVHF